jgi:hypothetical protein
VIKWFSSSDQSDPTIGLSCARLEKPAEFSLSGWNALVRLVTRIDPFV